MIATRTAGSDPADAKLAARRPRPTVDRCKAVALVWPSAPSERTKAFERWEVSAIHCLRSSPIGFALIVSLRRSLRSDGTITVTNRELVAAAGCSPKAIDRDLRMLKMSCLVQLTFGARRTIRLSMPAGGAVK